MRNTLHLLMTALLLVIFGISNAQTTQWYGYALGSFGAVIVYDMTGRLVFQGCYHGQRCFEGLKSGIYVVNTAGHSIKVMIE